jgi:serine/threonine-protein kinase
VLYEALAGVRPFRSADALVHDPELTEVVPLASRVPDLDPRFAGAIDRALARRPDQRFASAAAMAAAAGLSLAGLSAAGADLATRLENEPAGETAVMEGRTAVLGGDEIAEAPIAPPGRPPEADQRARRLRALALLAVVLLVLAGIGVALALRGNGGSPPGSTTTTTAPSTTVTTTPPTTRAPVTTTPTTRPPTTTTAPTTTTSSSTTTSSTTSTTSGVLGRGDRHARSPTNAVTSAGG